MRVKNSPVCKQCRFKEGVKCTRGEEYAPRYVGDCYWFMYRHEILRLSSRPRKSTQLAERKELTHQ